MCTRVFSPTYPTWALVGGTSRPAGETVYNSLDTPEIHLAHRLFGNYPFCVLQIKRNVSLVKLSWLITPTSKRSPPAPDYNYHHHALNQLSSLPGSPRVPVISPLPTQISAISQTVNCNIIQFWHYCFITAQQSSSLNVQHIFCIKWIKLWI